MEFEQDGEHTIFNLYENILNKQANTIMDNSSKKAYSKNKLRVDRLFYTKLFDSKLTENFVTKLVDIASEFNNFEFHPSIYCEIIMSIECGEKYVRHTIGHGYAMFHNDLTITYNEKFNSKESKLNLNHLVQGRKRISSNYNKILPYINISKARSFYETLKMLLIKIKYKFINESRLFGMI